MGHIERIREFNRFYAQEIGLLRQDLPRNVSYPDARLLYEIAADEPAQARVLAKRLALDEGYMSRLIKTLIERGLVTRTPSERDARINELRLSGQGQGVLERVLDAARQAVQDMIGDVPSAAVPLLLEAMNTLQGVLSWSDTSAPQLRDFGQGPDGAGDLGWIIKRNGELFCKEFDFDINFPVTIARIIADFADHRHQKALELGSSDLVKDRGWIAESNGQRLGCVFLVAESAKTARLRVLMVEPFARGKGIGQSLVQATIDHARQQGFEEIVLWTLASLEAACRLYARNGFELCDVQETVEFGQPVVNQVWRKAL